jgi:hypothetical protein
MPYNIDEKVLFGAPFILNQVGFEITSYNGIVR